MRRSNIVLGVLCLALTKADPAKAEQTTSDVQAAASKAAEEGLTLYRSHDYRKAIERFLDAYSRDPDPNLMFNIARCYEALGDGPAAIEKYELFLSKPGGDIGGRTKAEEALKRLRTKKEAPPREANSGAVVPTKEAVNGSAADQHAGLATTQVVGLVAGAAGILGLGVGTAFGLRAKSKNDDAGKLCNGSACQNSEAIRLTDDARGAATVSTVGFVAGGAFVVGGALLYFFSSPPKAPTAAQVVPHVGSQSASISLMGVW